MRLHLILFAACGFALPAWAQDAQADLKIERISLFKNGLGYFTSRAELPGADRVTLGQLPVPSHGTFWVAYDKDTPVRSIITAMQETTERRPFQNIAELL